MATIWTQADIDSIKAAILALASGQRKVSATFGGRTAQYSEVDLVKLQDLLADMQRQVRGQPTTRFVTVKSGYE